jgi:hypothetical protein
MGALFGLEGGFVTNRCRNAMSAPSPLSPEQPHRGPVDTVGKVPTTNPVRNALMRLVGPRRQPYQV